MLRTITLFCFFALLCVGTSAGVPFICHYGIEDYGSGHTTWRIASYENWTFFANERALLTFDGVSWERHMLNNRSEVRGVAVFPKQHRVYVGGENEYGFFEVGQNGVLQYHCLSDSVDKKFREVGNVWEIYELSGVLYLRCDDYILIMHHREPFMIESKDKIFASILVDGVIYVATDHGVKMVAGERLLPITGGAVLDHMRINSMFKYKQGMIVTTSNDGMFYYNGRSVTPFPTAADRLLKEGVICCAAINGDLVALGTIHNGVVIINLATGEVKNYNEMHGLQNNTVLSISFDASGNLWAGMDYGIDYILLNAPYFHLYGKGMSYGIGYSAQVFQNNLYLGTDRGLFMTPLDHVLEGQNINMNRIDSPSGPAWFLYSHHDELFCLHDKGIFCVNGTKASKITDVIGAWSCVAQDGTNNRLFVGLYSGICILEKINGQWRSLGRIKGISESCRYFRQTGKQQLTVYNRNLNLAEIYQLDSSYQKVISHKTVRKVWIDSLSDVPSDLYEMWDASGNIIKLDKQINLIPCSAGFILYKPDVKVPPVRTLIHRMLLTAPRDSVVYRANFSHIKSSPIISFDNNSVRFDFRAVALQVDGGVTYQYRLNDGEWSDPTTSTSKEYSNLLEGTYTFEVRACSGNHFTEPDSITFTILSPWYRTWIANLIYIFLLCCGGFVIYQYARRYVWQKQNLAVEQKTKEMKIEIDQLEKDKIDLELKHKNQEIANLIISVARKNETLFALKESIRSVAVKLSKTNTAESKRELLMINNSIEASMEGDELLKRFEEQFDLVNNNFMQRLSQKHPDLSGSERLMCAYLKMNLSTKEIAPLLNISVRGVETMRYRIRKKFNLERDMNLIDYINSFA